VSDELTVDEVKMVVEQVAQVYMAAYAEPMPPFDSHDPAKLQGALAAPFQSAFGEDIYQTVYLKAAALFYFVAKDHAFENGNKRTAVVVLLYYLAKNGSALQISPRRLYELAVAAVESQRSKDEIVQELAAFIAEHCVPAAQWLARALKQAKRSDNA
jgi:death-on-curing protein